MGLCVCVSVCVDVCAWAACVNKSNNNVCSVSTSIWGRQVQTEIYTVSEDLCLVIKHSSPCPSSANNAFIYPSITFELNLFCGLLSGFWLKCALADLRSLQKCLSRRDKVEVDVDSSECVCASTAALGCIMLFKSGLRKSQSCCWQSQFSALGVSVAPGHETHWIYAWDKEGGIHEAWWSASDTIPQSDLGKGGWEDRSEEKMQGCNFKSRVRSNLKKMWVMKTIEGEGETRSAKIWLAEVYSSLAPVQHFKNGIKTRTEWGATNRRSRNAFKALTVQPSWTFYSPLECSVWHGGRPWQWNLKGNAADHK